MDLAAGDEAATEAIASCARTRVAGEDADRADTLGEPAARVAELAVDVDVDFELDRLDVQHVADDDSQRAALADPRRGTQQRERQLDVVEQRLAEPALTQPQHAQLAPAIGLEGDADVADQAHVDVVEHRVETDVDDPRRLRAEQREVAGNAGLVHPLLLGDQLRRHDDPLRIGRRELRVRETRIGGQPVRHREARAAGRVPALVDELERETTTAHRLRLPQMAGGDLRNVTRLRTHRTSVREGSDKPCHLARPPRPYDDRPMTTAMSRPSRAPRRRRRRWPWIVGILVVAAVWLVFVAVSLNQARTRTQA